MLDTIDNPKLQTQQTVTIALTHILPKGLLGIFAAVMFAAFVSTHDTYLHSWGSIFIQDVVLPIRQMIVGEDKPMSPKAHLRLLRYSIFGVAVFIFLFSLFFRQRQDILMFFALTGTFFLGWAGCTICGGLYWKYGTTPGAWAAAIVGLVLSLGGWYLTYFWDNCKAGFASLTPGLWQRAVDFYPGFVGDKFPFSAQVLFFWSMVATGIVYMVVSLAGGKKAFNMDRMLHRGEYAMADDPDGAKPKVGLAALRMDKKFARDDRILYIISLLYTFVCFVGFIAVTVRFVVFEVEISDAAWGKFWWFYSLGMLIFTSVITLWFAVGGVFDLKDLFSSLATVKRDVEDDGTVVGPEILPDERVEGGARAARQEV